MDLRKYLARIGYEGPVEPTLENLAAIHRCHVLSVPFGSLSIHCGEPIIPELPLLYQKIVVERRGGFCYELNGLFSWLLGELGFRLRLLSARVRNSFTGRLGPPFDHLVILAEEEKGEGGPRLCDVGFGNAFRAPLRLEEGREERQENGVFALRRATGGEWVLRRSAGGPADQEVTLYTFTLEGRSREDFGDMCRYHQVSPRSVFVCKSFCSLHLPGGMLTYVGKRLIATCYTPEGEVKTTTELTEEEIPRILEEKFGIELKHKLVPKDQEIQVPPLEN